MGSAAEYICEKCGWKTTINMRQPDCGFMGECLEKYCPITDQIIWILLGIGDKYDIGCQNKENDIPAEEQHLSCKNCTAECLEELVILEKDKDDVVVKYKCPRHECSGEMNIASDGVCVLWD